MEKRETTKRLEIKGRDFVLEKFDPLFGVYLATTFLGADHKNGMEGIIKSLLSKPKNEFIQLEKDILSYCYEILPSGRVKLIDDGGNFAVQDMTSALVLSIVVQSLMFSLTDFFDQEVMKNLMSQAEQTLKGLDQSSPQKN